MCKKFGHQPRIIIPISQEPKRKKYTISSEFRTSKSRPPYNIIPWNNGNALREMVGLNHLILYSQMLRAYVGAILVIALLYACLNPLIHYYAIFFQWFSPTTMRNTFSHIR